MPTAKFNKFDGRFQDRKLEQLYVVDAWPRVQNQLRIVFGCAGVMVLGMLLANVLDQRLVEVLTTLLLFRFTQLLAIITLLWLLRSGHYSRKIFIALMFAELATMAVEMVDYFVGYLPFEKTPDSLDMPFMVLMIFIIYALIPNRSYTNIGVCVTSTLSFLAILFMAHDVTIGAATYLIMMFVFVNVVGMAYESYINRIYRRDFLRRLELEREVSQRLKAQAELVEARDALERLNESRSKFLAAASHDLRQPLHALSFFLESLKIEDGRNRHILHKAMNAKDSLSLLLDSILDISRLEVGDINVHKQPIPLANLFTRLLDEYTPCAAAQNIELKVVNTSAVVTSDTLLLERVVRNLLDNALKYTNKGRVVLGVRRQGKFTSIQVWDTGIGINKLDQQKIFKEFHQIDNPERDRSKGLGLGLTIVQRICQLLAYPFTVRSSFGKGSCFSFQVETSTQVPLSKADAYTLPNSIAGMTVVVIDDEETIREATGLLLEGWQCSTMLCADGAMAARMIDAAGTAPDLIISDYRLKGPKTGVEQMQKLLADYDLECPVLLVTGETSSSSIRDASLSGFPLLHKPLKPAKLRLYLNQLLSDNSAA